MAQKTFTFASMLLVTSTITACGGGGGAGGIASTGPAPVTAVATPPPTATAAFTLPPTPATTTGRYGGVTLFSSTDGSHLTAPLQESAGVRIDVDASTRTYTLTVEAGPYSFPSGEVKMPGTSDLGSARSNPIQSGTAEQFTTAARVARGDLLLSAVPAPTASGAPRALITYLILYNVGHADGMPSYLSAANWGQWFQEYTSAPPSTENAVVTQRTSGFMVFGPRTAPADIPVSGHATYALEGFPGAAANTLGPYYDEDGNRYNPDGDTVLDVEFATRRLSATYDLAQNETVYRTDSDGQIVADPNGDAIAEGSLTAAVHASGNTLLGTDGAFSIPISGTGSVHIVDTAGKTTLDALRPVSGDITGAFFGPQAAEAGGVWNLPTMTSYGSGAIIGTFAGLRKP